MCERPKLANDTAECPLCKEIPTTLGQYLRHVGRHQEDLALFALPQLPDEDPSEDDIGEDEQIEEGVEVKDESDEVEGEDEFVHHGTISQAITEQEDIANTRTPDSKIIPSESDVPFFSHAGNFSEADIAESHLPADINPAEERASIYDYLRIYRQADGDAEKILEIIYEEGLERKLSDWVDTARRVLRER
ncbi:hypothetical protein NW762_003988 [Fusarium torreyae]|uniref:DUF7889 domain-containing protein n=1 Tax=Fusarium torreyae TaxID=1237075 RepID=A0A9W8VJU5_9HYPO|nr:hypothetical protein NW762_003988 [Fusarium torreyae]